MKTTILIDLNSIKKNPKAGYQSEYFPIKKEIDFEIKAKELPNYMIYSNWNTEGMVEINYDRNCELTEIQFDEFNPDIKIFKGIIIDPFLIEMIQKDKNLENSHVKINNQHIRIQHFEPQYTYKYIHTEVQCRECEKTFMSNEFKSDEIYDNWEDDYYSSDRVCPLCGHFDCADIEYEDIDDALLRMKKII